jgi:hypothetical protein
MGLPFVRLAALGSGSCRWSRGVDPWIRQTSAASPAEPGNSYDGLGCIKRSQAPSAASTITRTTPGSAAVFGDAARQTGVDPGPTWRASFIADDADGADATPTLRTKSWIENRIRYPGPEARRSANARLACWVESLTCMVCTTEPVGQKRIGSGTNNTAYPPPALRSKPQSRRCSHGPISPPVRPACRRQPNNCCGVNPCLRLLLRLEAIEHPHEP